MHDSVLAWIDKALSSEAYVEACWVAYACFESRVNRIIEKVIGGCPKAQRDSMARPIGITTKIQCLVRLSRTEHPFFEPGDDEILNSVKGWCKKRNDLVHKMVTPELYDASKQEITSLAKQSRTLVIRSYKMATHVRECFYGVDKVPEISEAAVKACSCNKRCIREAMNETACV